MEGCTCVRCAAGDDLRFTFWCRVFYADVETAPSNRITQAPLFVAGNDHKRNASCANRSKLGNRELKSGQGLKQHCFDRFFYLVNFVNEKHTGTFGFESPHERAGPEEIATLESLYDLLPTQTPFLREFHVELLEAVVEFTARLFMGDALVALHAFDMS